MTVASDISFTGYFEKSLIGYFGICCPKPACRSTLCSGLDGDVILRTLNRIVPKKSGDVSSSVSESHLLGKLHGCGSSTYRL